MTGDKIIPFSVRECQRHAKGSTGVAAAPAGINVRIVDHAAQATAAAARLPPPGPREPGGRGALQKAAFEKHLLNENTGRGAEAHRTTPTFLTHRLPRAFLHAFIHSFTR